MTKVIPSFLLLIACLAPGCAVGPSRAPAEAYYTINTWLGASIDDLTQVMGPPNYQEEIDEHFREFRWRKEVTNIGPPRHQFGPNGKIKTRPGLITWRYCDIKTTAEKKGCIVNFELTGDCPYSLLPPARTK